MTGTQNKTAARAAAEWWAEQIGHPVHKATEGGPNDPDREYGEFTFMAMAIIASHHPVSDEQGTAFADALEKSIAHTGSDVSLSVDYGPCLMLANAGDAAGVDRSRFPWKTHMRVRPEYVTASLGYRAPDRLIWQAPDWERPACGSMAYDERTNRFDEKLCGLPRFHEEREHGDWQPDTARCAKCGKSQAEHWNSDAITHIYDRGGVS